MGEDKRRLDSQHDDTRHNGTQHNRFNFDTQMTISTAILGIVMLIVVMLRAVSYSCSEHHYQWILTEGECSVDLLIKVACFVKK